MACGKRGRYGPRNPYRPPGKGCSHGVPGATSGPSIRTPSPSFDAHAILRSRVSETDNVAMPLCLEMFAAPRRGVQGGTLVTRE